MSIKLNDYIGKKFNLLTIESRSDNDRFDRTRWNCLCDCGGRAVVAYFRLKSGHTKSCGCIKGKSRAKPYRDTPTYNTWLAIKQRCFYERHEQYENYGGRGIKVCERWSISFDDFVADMGLKPDGMSIERIDVNGDYEPGNCKWATNEEQSRNRRSNINITMNGKTQCVKDWCDELGLNQDKVYGRIRWGRSPVEALKCVINQS